MADRGRSSTGLASLGPPAIAFALGRAVLFLAALRAFRFEPTGVWLAASWVRWDALHYLEIAGGGYRLMSCAEVSGYAPADWCGNAAWFPGYPALIRLLMLAGVPAVPAAVLLSASFAFLALHALWTRLLGGRVSRGTLLALAIAAVAPGVVYQHAAFPIAMLLFFQIRALDALARERFFAAGAWGAAAAITYSSGWLLGLGMVAYALLGRRALTPARLAREALLPAGLTAAGTALVFLLHQLLLGDWQAFFKIQRKYGVGLHWPHQALVDRLAPLFGDGTLFPALQTLLVVVSMLGLLLALVLQWRRLAPIEALVSLHALVYWLVPLALGGGLSLHRADAVLMPAAILTRRLPAPVQLLLLAAAAVTALRVGARYFSGVLV